MKRTTTPQHIFRMSINPFHITKLTITYAQTSAKIFNDDTQQKIILIKYLEDCDIGDDYVSVTLTQEETNLFSDGIVNIQLHVEIDGKVLQSDIIRTYCCQVLNDEVIE